MDRRLAFIAVVSAGILPQVVQAQALAQQSPHIGYAFPAGGRQGTTFEVRVGGEFLDGITSGRVSGSGVQVKVVELVKPMTQQQANQLREQLKALTDRMPSTAAKPAGKATGKQGDKPANKVSGTLRVPSAQSPQNTTPLSAEERQTVLDIRKKLLKFFNRPTNPAIAQTAVLQITTSPDAEPGTRELRLETPAGLTNPLVFQIGRLPEVVRKTVADDDLPGRQPIRKLREEGRSATSEQPTINVQLPVVVNGQVLSGQIDRYRFAAKKGQHLVIAVSAQQLVPYIADAVPGWFQAAIKLSDEEGKELAYAGSYRFHPDPVLQLEVPRDGKYAVQICDSCFRGREDFIYRMALGELPFVTGFFPLGGKAGETTYVTLQGCNLPFTSLTEDATRKAAGIDHLAVGPRSGFASPLTFALDSLPECMEQEPNDSPEHAQPVTIPVIVNGRIDRPGDRDVFRFEGTSGQEIVAEVYARRLDSPLDSVLKLTDSSGRQLAFNDDHEDKGCGLITHHADSWLRAVLPSTGTYYLHLYDAQNQGGPEYAYRLRISPPRPDFELRVVPSSVNARAGTAVPVTVHALRRDGFNGPINLQLKDAPTGFSLSGAKIPAGQAKTRLTLTVPLDPGRPTTAPAHGRPRDDRWPRSAPHRRPCRRHDAGLFLSSPSALAGVAGRHHRSRTGGDPLPASRAERDQTALRQHGRTPLYRPAWPARAIGQDDLERAARWAVDSEGHGQRQRHQGTLRADAAKLKPGWKGNAIIEASVERVPDVQKGKVKPIKRRVSLGMLPAIPLEIVGK